EDLDAGVIFIDNFEQEYHDFYDIDWDNEIKPNVQSRTLKNSGRTTSAGSTSIDSNTEKPFFQSEVDEDKIANTDE
ncbi:hypothetical protein SARC_13417, partial [Sphaeroforma arctica JP610]